MSWQLQDSEGNEVTFPCNVTDFRGDKSTLVGGNPPHKPSSTGKVWADEYGPAYYPSVYGLKWVEV